MALPPDVVESRARRGRMPNESAAEGHEKHEAGWQRGGDILELPVRPRGRATLALDLGPTPDRFPVAAVIFHPGPGYAKASEASVAPPPAFSSPPGTAERPPHRLSAIGDSRHPQTPALDLGSTQTRIRHFPARHPIPPSLPSLGEFQRSQPNNQPCDSHSIRHLAAHPQLSAFSVLSCEPAAYRSRRHSVYARTGKPRRATFASRKISGARRDHNNLTK